MQKSIFNQLTQSSNKVIAAFAALFFIVMLGTSVGGCVSQDRGPLNQSGVSANAVLVWANEAAVATYTYNHINYQQNLQNASQYFLPQAWSAFMLALKSSGNLQAVIDNKLVVGSVATGIPLIIEEGVVDNKYSWTVQLPLLVTYRNAAIYKKQHILVTMQVVRTPESIGVRGLSIAQFMTVSRDEDGPLFIRHAVVTRNFR